MRASIFFISVFVLIISTTLATIIERDGTKLQAEGDLLSKLPPLLKPKGVDQNSKLGVELTHKATMKIPSVVGNQVDVPGKNQMDMLMGTKASSSDVRGETKRDQVFFL